MVKPGLTLTVKKIVTEADTASRVGSGGMDVFATPCMVGLMENAAMTCVAPYLEEGNTTVGGHIDTSHIKPTPVGAEVSATAVLTKVDGRKLFFDVEARQGDTLLGQGTHLRFIVNRDKFLHNLYKG